MSQTMHDTIRAALIKKAVKEHDPEVYESSFPSPEKYKRMWKKITGEDISIEEAKQTLKKAVK